MIYWYYRISSSFLSIIRVAIFEQAQPVKTENNILGLQSEDYYLLFIEHNLIK